MCSKWLMLCGFVLVLASCGKSNVAVTPANDPLVEPAPKKTEEKKEEPKPPAAPAPKAEAELTPNQKTVKRLKEDYGVEISALLTLPGISELAVRQNAQSELTDPEKESELLSLLAQFLDSHPEIPKVHLPLKIKFSTDNAYVDRTNMDKTISTDRSKLLYTLFLNAGKVADLKVTMDFFQAHLDRRAAELNLITQVRDRGIQVEFKDNLDREIGDVNELMNFVITQQRRFRFFPTTIIVGQKEVKTNEIRDALENRTLLVSAYSLHNFESLQTLDAVTTCSKP